MQIKISPKNLQTLEVICEILYKLHPEVLDNLLDMEETLGPILGLHNINDDLTSEQVDIFEKLGIGLENLLKQEEQEEQEEQEDKLNNIKFDQILNCLNHDIIKKFGTEVEKIQQQEEELNNIKFDELSKYIKLDTKEYIPIEFYVKVEDILVGEKVQKLIKILERTKAKEEFSNMRREEDWTAYFCESYSSKKFSEKQQIERDNIFQNKDVNKLKKLLIKQNLYEIKI